MATSLPPFCSRARGRSPPSPSPPPPSSAGGRSALTDSLPRPPGHWLHQWAGAVGQALRRQEQVAAATMSRLGMPGSTPFPLPCRTASPLANPSREGSMEEVESDSDGYDTPPVVPSSPPSLPASPLPAPSPGSFIPMGPGASDFTNVFMPPGAMSWSLKFAFVYIEPASANPGTLIRRALYEVAGDPLCTLRPSSCGAMLLEFPFVEHREEVIRGSPYEFGSRRIIVERHEEADYRFFTDFSFFADVAATDFPLEHWFEANIRVAFASIACTVCIDHRCLAGHDYSNVRLVLKLAHHGVVPRKLIVHNAVGGLATVVDLHVIRMWSQPSDMQDLYDYDFSAYGFAPPPAGNGNAPNAHQGSPPAAGHGGGTSGTRFNGRGPTSFRTLNRGQPLIIRVPLSLFIVVLCSLIHPCTPAEMNTSFLRAMLLLRIRAQQLSAQFEALPRALAVAPMALPWHDEAEGAMPPRSPALDPLPEGDLGFEDPDLHELSRRKLRGRKRRILSSAFKERRSKRLTAKESEAYVGAVDKAARV